MNKQAIFIIICIIVVLCACSSLRLALNSYFTSGSETMVNIKPPIKAIKWGNDNSCKYKMIKIYEDVLNSYNIPKTTGNDWSIYFPCSYDDMNEEIEKIKCTDPDQRIFIVNNYNEISSKSHMWENLVNMYGRDVAQRMSPLTYILYDQLDIELLKKEFDPTKLYIMKKNVQRQEGLKITNNLDTMVAGFNDQYIVAQTLLQDPYLVHGRKINMRFYVLLVCQNNEISAYVHNDGFMYYTKMPFKPGTLDDAHNITTGYIERWVYHVNPLTHFDFRDYLDDPARELSISETLVRSQGQTVSAVVFDRVYDLLKRTVKSVDHTICTGSKLQNAISFQLFGADIAIDDTLNPKVIEINIGPNLNTHDERDRAVKFKVVSDIFKVLQIVPNQDNGFIQVI